MKRIVLIFILLLVSACEMENQPKYTPYRKSAFFPDGTSARQPVGGSVAKEDVRDLALASRADRPDAEIPMTISEEGARRGSLNFGIYCAPCHGAAGNGDGKVIERGFPRPKPLSDPEILRRKPGDLFRIVWNGYSTSPSFSFALDAGETWEVVRYVQILQGTDSGKK